MGVANGGEKLFIRCCIPGDGRLVDLLQGFRQRGNVWRASLGRCIGKLYQFGIKAMERPHILRIICPLIKNKVGIQNNVQALIKEQLQKL